MNSFKSIVLFFVLGVASNTFAQQTPLLSNYYVNPFINNPAYAGLKGNNLFLLNRSQWQGVDGKPETIMATLDGVLQNGKVGYGGLIYNDVVNILGKTGIFGTYSYKVSFTNKSVLSLGFSMGFEQNRILFDRVRAEVPVEITLLNNASQISNFDANFGLSYHIKGLNIGVAGYQLFGNKNVITNIDTREKFNFRFVRHIVGTASYRIALKPGIFYIDPLLTVRSGIGIKPQTDFSVLGNLKDKVWLGAGYRQEYGMDFMAGTVLTNKITIGYSYGLSTGAIKKLSQNSHEVILGFKFSGKNTSQDTDHDGVADIFDREIATISGCAVDKYGVSLDTDQDKVPDCLDKQVNSPFGAPVDSDGIAFDSDKDNVIDLYDREPNTPDNCPVDKYGIALDGDKDGVPDCRDKEQNSPYAAIVDAEGVSFDIDKDRVPDIRDKQIETPHWQHTGEQPYKDASKCIVDENGIAKDSDGDGLFDCVDYEIFSPKGSKVDKNGIATKKKAEILPEKSIDTDGDGVSDELDLEPGTLKGSPVDQWGRSALVPKDPALSHRIQIDEIVDNSEDWDYYVIVGVFRQYSNLKNYQKYLLKTYSEKTQVLVTDEKFYYVWTKKVISRADAKSEVDRLNKARLGDYIVGNPWLWREARKK